MRCAFFLFFFCIIVVRVGAYGAGNDPDEKLRLEEGIRNLQAADANWRRSDADFRKLRKEKQASNSEAPDPEIIDYAVFTAELKRKVIEACEVVRKLGGDAGKHGIDCIKIEDESESKKGGGSLKVNREPTREEKAALLQSQLEKIENGFDGMIRKHELKQRRKGGVGPSVGGWGSGPGKGDSEAKTTGGAGALEGGAASSSKEEQIHREAEPGAGPGVIKEGEMPEFETGKVGEASDDDIVAQQLREAAEAETDPILKEKLWDEYKKYKRSIH